jgi:hypothetical protein
MKQYNLVTSGYIAARKNEKYFFFYFEIRDSSVGIALGYGPDDRGPRVRFPAGAGNFSLHHRIQNGSRSHPASSRMGSRGSFRGGKAAGEWSWPLTSIYCQGQECVELYSTPQYVFMAWCLVKHRDNFTFVNYEYLVVNGT